VANIDLDADRPLVWFKERLQRFARGAFQQADKVRRAQYRRHSIAREVDHMLLLHHEL